MVNEVQLLNALRQLLQANPTFNPSAELSLHAVGELGAGGMGVVYRVQDTRLGREAALKLIRGTPSPTVLARFRREVEVTAQLDHPSIPPVYDAGTNSLGQAFMVMRLVEGQTLSERIEALHASSPPDPQAERELVEAVVKLGEALAYAHSQQVIHRDLKPANVIVGRFGEVQLMDWGLAKRLDRSDDDDVPMQSLIQDAPAGAELTQAGAVLGTPGYMSPEQCDGPAVDARADVFALGALLCTVLTGRPPVRKTTALNTVTATLKGEIEHPRDLRPDVPAELNAIAAAALHPDARRRTQTAAAFVADLKAYLAGRPVSAYRYGALDRARRWARAHPTLLVAAALLAALVAVAGGALAIVLQARGASAQAEIEAERAEAKAQRVEAEAQAQLAAEQAARVEAEQARTQRERARAYRALAEARLAQGRLRLATALSAAALELEDRPELRVLHGRSRRGPWRKPRLLRPSEGRADQVSWSADGRWLAVGAKRDGGRVTVFDAERGEEVLAFDAHPGKGLGTLAFSPTRPWLATGHGYDESRRAPPVRVWSIPDGERVAEVELPLRGVLDLRWSPAGEALAIGGHTNYPLVWLLTGKVVALEGTNLLWARSPAWSPDAKRIASGGLDNSVAIWSLAQTQQPAAVLKGHHGHVTAVGYAPTFGRRRPWGSPDGRLASSSRDATLRIWEVSDARAQASGGQVFRTPDSAEAMAWGPRGRLLAACCGEWIQVWDLELERALALRVGSAQGIAWNTKQELAVACGDAVQVWDFGFSPAAHGFRVSDGLLAGVAWHESGETFVVAENQSGLPGKAALVGEWKPDGTPQLLALVGNVRGERVQWASRGSRVVLTASMSALQPDPSQPVRDYKVSRVIEWAANQTRAHPDCFVPEGVQAGAVSHDGQRYATVGGISRKTNRGQVRLWDLGSGKLDETWAVEELKAPGSAAEWTPDGRLVVAWGSLLTVLDGQSGEVRARHSVPGGRVSIMNLAAQPQGDVLAAATPTKLVLFDLAREADPPFARLDLEGVTCLDWSQSGRFLAVGTSDALQVWSYDADARSLTLLCALPADDRIVASDWNAQDQLVCGFRRGTVNVFDLPRLLADPEPLDAVLEATGLTRADLEHELGR